MNDLMDNLIPIVGLFLGVAAGWGLSSTPEPPPPRPVAPVMPEAPPGAKKVSPGERCAVRLPGLRQHRDDLHFRVALDRYEASEAW